ncbi:MAG TPA: Rpn family recombination-promoting nuclease/putative transposase [Chthonomonadaceae bacterium]|nr:Rpn family recombination-promoting nuclease/putative transposase [Chthonomonadaceae bacterium]
MPEESDPPLHDFVDRATRRLLDLTENLRELLLLAGSGIAEQLDFSRAVAIDRTLIGDNLTKGEADLLYRVPSRDGCAEVIIVLLVEHQSRPDTLMGLRLLCYIVAVWQQEVRNLQSQKRPRADWRLSPIVPMVLYTECGAGGETSDWPRSWPCEMPSGRLFRPGRRSFSTCTVQTEPR